MAGRIPSWLVVGFGLLAMLVSASARSAQGAEKHIEITDRDVLAAVRKGVDYLLSEAKDGHWSNTSLQEKREFMGETALGLYALLQAGHAIDDLRLNPKSPQLTPIVKYVTDTKPLYTYDAALKAVALGTLRPRERGPEQKAALEECRDYLFKIVTQRNDGAYPYRLEQVRSEPRYWDHSNSQYAVLGMWAIADAGLDVPPRYWALVDKHWRSSQNADGGWGYTQGGKSTRSMSAAGLATLFIAEDHVVSEAVGEIRNDPALEQATGYLTQSLNFNNDLYYLFSMERAGLAAGLRYLDKSDWYRTAATGVLKWQQDDGSWYSSYYAGDDRVTATAYAILFLTRGRNPVIFNKLQYGSMGSTASSPWNARPRDDANLTRYLSKQFETPLNWQTVSTRMAIEDWLEAPVLLVVGRGNWQPTAEELAKLRSFMEAGGIIFSTTDGGDDSFTLAVRKYAKQLVDGKYEMRPLPKDHLLYTLGEPMSQPPLVLGLSNGVRELWLHSPSDMGGVWQRKDYGKAGVWQFPANLCLYVTGRASPRSRLQSLAVPTVSVPLSRTAKLVRIRYKGNWDPEPGAWPRLAKLSAEYDTQLQITVKDASKVTQADGRLAHLSATEALTLDEMETGKLRIFLKAGGTLLLEASGGSVCAAPSLTTLALTLFPEAKLEPVPLTDALFSDGVPGAVRIRELAYRRCPATRVAKAEGSGLWGIRQNERWVILFSPDDITSGLLGTATWGIQGYTPDSAQALGRNIVVHTGIVEDLK